MRKGLLIVALAGTLTMTMAASAQAINITYGFDAGDQGWRSVQSSSQQGTDSVTWNPGGGNPGGYISKLDTGSDTDCSSGGTCDLMYFVSPGVSGGMAANYGGSISFDLGSNTLPGFAGVAYIDSTDGRELRRLVTTNAAVGFQHYSVPLVADGSWFAYPSATAETGVPADPAAMQSVLAGGRWTDLLVDIVGGTGETYSLDNFTISEPPPPAAPVKKKKKCKKKKGKTRASSAKKKKCKKKKKSKSRIAASPTAPPRIPMGARASG